MNKLKRASKEDFAYLDKGINLDDINTYGLEADFNCGYSIQDIANRQGVPYYVVEEIAHRDGWYDHEDDDNMITYSKISEELPYPKETSDLIALLYYIRDIVGEKCEKVPTTSELNILNRTHSFISKYVKKSYNIKGLKPMTLDEARTRQVTWLKQFEEYMKNYVEQGD